MSDVPAVSYAASLPFLLSQVGARAAQEFADRLAPLGVSPRAFGVLSNLTGGATGRTQQQLADALGMHRNNMVGLIDEMEAAGWVRRRRSAQDRRAFEIDLTPAGAALLEQVAAVIPPLEAEIARDLTADERRVLADLLLRVGVTLELHPGIHPHLRARPRSTGAAPEGS
ncbi:MarR family winged helix-turn-helix transcriptional regulator [Parafrankia discariae]|uniref:MarR family winged helix-turn-helix transcriptional regulator n=1 Tax=Parafrankia discariae TaxID=365528 RepID=UPI00036106ED|nr:MarR family transcriptional regulator [Parafrankia discariae]